MTRLDLLQIVVARARSNGFEFRRWYTIRMGLPWISADAALRLLDAQRRYYALLFSHEFASNFWKTGTEISFELPANSFQRRMPDGTMRTIQRKAFVRRSARRDVWRYHLREMALAEEPLRYLRRYLHVEEQLDPDPETEPPPRPQGRSKTKGAASTSDPIGARAKKRLPGKRLPPRPLPTGLPAFLQRPYPAPASQTGPPESPGDTQP